MNVRLLGFPAEPVATDDGLHPGRGAGGETAWEAPAGAGVGGRVALLAVALAVSCARPETDASLPDWSAIPAHTLALFYPGQSSYEWLLSPAHREGSDETAAGERCTSCHEDEEVEIGEALVSGGPLEPTPLPGKPGTIDLRVQVAYDDVDAWFRFQWRTRNAQPGEAHPFHRFGGTGWRTFGGPKLDPAVRAGEQPAIYEDRLSMMIDDGSVPGFAVHGCWITCHDGQRDMPGRAAREEVEAHPILGRGGLGKKDVRKYLPSTRTGRDWRRTRSAAQIAGIGAEGGFLDLMQWRAHRSNPVGMADDFYVLEYRLQDAGQGPFCDNWDAESHHPKYMYDATVYGSHATRIDRIRLRPTALVREQNAAPFDATLDWREGDLVPVYVISRADAHGSAADNRRVHGSWQNGSWTVVWARPLGLANPDDKPLREGSVYTFGFAVHDDNVTTRGHHVSWPVTVGFGVEADIEATRIR